MFPECQQSFYHPITPLLTKQTAGGFSAENPSPRSRPPEIDIW